MHLKEFLFRIFWKHFVFWSRSNARKVFEHPLLRGASIYGLSAFFGKIFPLLLLPVVAKYLAPSEFGIVSTVLVLYAAATIVVDCGMATHISVNYFVEAKRVELVTHSIFVVCASAFLLGCTSCVCVVAFGNSKLLSLNWILAIVAIACSKAISNIQLMMWQLDQKFYRFAAAQVLISLFEGGLIYVLLVDFGYKWEGRVSATLWVAAFSGIFSVIYLFKRSVIDISIFDIALARSLGLAGCPLIIHGFGGWMIVSMDKYLLTRLVGPESTGIYALAGQIASIVGFLTIAFNQAWAPYLFRYLSVSAPNRRKLVGFTYAYGVLLAIVCLLYYLAVKVAFGVFFGAKYSQALEFLPLLLVQTFLWGMYYMVTNYIFFAQKARQLAYVTFFCGVLSFALTIFLISLLGAWGGAISAIVVGVVYLLSTWRLANAVYPMPWLTFGGGFHDNDG